MGRVAATAISTKTGYPQNLLARKAGPTPPRLWIGPIDDVLRAVENFEISRNSEQGRVGIAALDVRKLERLIAHARIAALTVNDGLKVGRGPNLRHDADGLVVADLTGGNCVRRAHSVDEHSAHGLRAEVLGAFLVVTPHLPLDEKRRWRRPWWRRRARGNTAAHLYDDRAGDLPAVPTAGGQGWRRWAFSGRFFQSSSMCGRLRHRVADENEVRRVGGGEIANHGQGSILAGAAL